MSYSEINPQGYASPYIKAFLSDGTEVTLNIVSFEYKYAESKDDICLIELEYDDPSIVDRRGFQEDVEWTVRWGYIGGKTATRKIYLREINPSFTRKGVKIKIDATCKGSYLKERSEKRVNKNKTLIQVAETIASDNGLNIVGPKALYKTENGEVFGLVSTTKDIATPTSENLTVELEFANEDEPAVLNQNSYDRSRELKDITITLGEQKLAQDNARSQSTHFFIVHADYLQGNFSEIGLLEDMASKETGGPVVVETRDDDLIIKKRPLDSPPVRIFKYQRDTRDLLSFKPESKSQSKKKKASNTNVGGWDMDKKKYVERNVTEGSDEQPRLGDEIEGSPRKLLPRRGDEYGYVGNADLRTAPGFIIEDQVVNFVEGTDYNTGEAASMLVPEAAVDDGDVTNDQILIVGRDYLNAAPGEDLIDIQYNDVTGLDFFIEQTTSIDNTAVILPTGGIIDMHSYIETVEDLKSDDANQAKNERSNAAMDMNPGTLTAEGDPSIETGQVITVVGVGKKYSGNYYITESKHKIVSNNGYIMTIVCKRNAKNSTGNAVGTNASLEQFVYAKKLENKQIVTPGGEDGPTLMITKYFNAATDG
tara:strand:+ start:24057 stop:25838 length:1782 start_codon:yes stop_codon:yes gene_type:complete